MRKTITLFILGVLIHVSANSQITSGYELSAGLRFQKTEQLYWENGVGADFTSDFLLKKRIHLNFSYTSSRFGSAMIGNAVKQDNFLLGASWHFRADKPLQIIAGLNTGFFHADMEIPAFDVLPHNCMLLSAETGLFYKFKFPVATSLTFNYNFVNGNGVDLPGTLFPVYYQLSVFYYLHR